MSTLSTLIGVSEEEQPFIDFESSIDDDRVVSGYIPVNSTLDVFKFLQNATSPQTSEGRAVICWGNYGTGKSRLCVLLARLLRDGFDCEALKPVLQRLRERGHEDIIDDLKQVMMPGGMEWRKWLVVPMYAQAGEGTLSTALIKSLLKSLRDNELDHKKILGQTIYEAAASRLIDLIENTECEYIPADGSPYTDYKQLERALIDFDVEALGEFEKFHLKASGNISFKAYLEATGGVDIKVHDVYNTVVEKIKSHGYAGIIVIWDEFGFAIEKLLKRKTLEDEVLELQDFLQKSCSNDFYDKRIIFMGFTHVSLSEYGTREGLGETAQTRLQTIEGRFRDPAIRITLGITETEGYHLLGGLTLRTEEGIKIFENPIINLQSIARKMPSFRLWDQLNAGDCYNDIVAPCYPLHPAAASSLLILSDQIAQVNRTTFYFLQNRDSNGLVWFLENTELPSSDEMGSAELMRVHELFDFFEQTIMEHKGILYGQYKEAIGLYPTAEEIDRNILRTTLILRVIATPDLASSTDLLCFCLTDSSKNDVEAAPVHESLKRLSEANVLWRNDATDVWDFVGGRGVNAEIESKLKRAKDLIQEGESTDLFLLHPEIQDEITDIIEDFDLDPSDSGVVRRISIRILDLEKGLVPKISTSEEKWLSGVIFLVLAEQADKLTYLQEAVQDLKGANNFYVIPPQPHEIEVEKLRELIAVLELLGKTDPSEHTYDVLEGKLTNLRTILRAQFEKSFGNEGLRQGTIAVMAGAKGEFLRPTSWNHLLTIVGQRIDATYDKQIKVRCGTFNVWNKDKQWTAIKRIVSRILRYDETPENQEEYLGFKITSQEAAIVDGVLLENQYLIEDPLEDEWKLIEVGKNCPSEVLALIYKHFTTAGRGKEFNKLYAKLIEAPYGIPNGIIPLLIALVFRNEVSRIGVIKTKGKKSQVVSPTKIPEAIVEMGRGEEFTTRYQKLNIRQRVTFKVIGSALKDVGEWNDAWQTGDEFIEYCDKVKNTLHAWLKELPQEVEKLPDLTEKQREFIKSFRLLIPPHLTNIADSLLEIFEENGENCGKELVDITKDTNEFPAITEAWKNIQIKIAHHEKGVKEPLQAAVFDVIGLDAEQAVNPQDMSQKIGGLGVFQGEDHRFKKIIKDLDNADSESDPIDIIASSISEKGKTKLTGEDYGRARGFFEAIKTIEQHKNLGKQEKHQGEESGDEKQSLLTLPCGSERVLCSFSHDEQSRVKIADVIKSWHEKFGYSHDELAFLVLDAIYQEEGIAEEKSESSKSHDSEE